MKRVRKILENKQFLIYLSLSMIVILIAILAPILAPKDPYHAVMLDSLKPPSKEYILGTDVLGRDIFSRIIYGCRVSLSVGIISQIIATVIGYTMGVCAGYFGGKVDSVISFLIIRSIL